MESLVVIQSDIFTQKRKMGEEKGKTGTSVFVSVSLSEKVYCTDPLWIFEWISKREISSEIYKVIGMNTSKSRDMSVYLQQGRRW